METLDFGEIMRNDDCWFENYNLTCPYCNGLGTRTVYIRGSIRSYKKFDSYLREDEEYCEHCNDSGEFDIAWNIAFHVFLPYKKDFDELYKLAWDGGFCLIEHNNDYFLLMGMSGSDCTWMIYNIRLKIQGFLNQEDIKTCISSGGSEFVSEKERKKMCKYFKENVTTPEEYTKSYRNEIAKIDGVAKSRLYS